MIIHLIQKDFTKIETITQKKKRKYNIQMYKIQKR